MRARRGNSTRFPATLPNSFGARRLTELRGVGDALAGEMYALWQQERLEVLDELYAQVPKGVLGLLRISGLGPKKVRLLWLSGIENTAQLVAEIENGRVAKLKGFGAKSAQTILGAAKFALRAAARLRLDEAEVLAVGFTAALAQTLPKAKLTWVGELRRSLETVGVPRALVVGVTADALEAGLKTFCSSVETTQTGFTVMFGERKLELVPTEISALGTATALETGDDAFASALQARATKKRVGAYAVGDFLEPKSVSQLRMRRTFLGFSRCLIPHPNAATYRSVYPPKT